MKKILKSTFTVLLCVILAMFMCISTFAEVTKAELDAKKKEITELQNLLYQQNKTKQETEEKLASLGSEIEATEETKNELLYQIENISEEIDTTNLLIEGYKNYIDLKTVEIEETENDLYDQEQAFRAYLRCEYELGSSTVRYIEILMNSESLSAFLSNVHYIGSMLDYQEHLMSRYEATITKLNTQKTELDEAKAEKEEYIVQLNEKKAESEALVVQANEYVAQLELSQDNLLEYKENSEDEIAALAAEIKKEQEEQKKLQADYDAYQAYLAKKKAEEEAAKRKAEEEAAKNQYKQVLGDKYFMWPVNASKTFKISTWYGWEKNPIGSGNRFHNGIDIAMASGSDIYASASGKVIIAKYSSSYGNYLVILHDNGYSTLYAHASKLLVSVGDRVAQGKIIARVGSTGWSTGAHLHFEIYIPGGETRVDPFFYFTSIYKSHVNDSIHNDNMNTNTKRYRPEKGQTTM